MGNVHEVSDSKYYINRQHRVEFYVQQFFFEILSLYPVLYYNVRFVVMNID